MTVPGISFPETGPARAPDPNRMDIALFVGFLPLREGAEAAAARAAVAGDLALRGWADRVAATGDSLADLPVRCRSIEEVEALFDTGGRIDRAVRVQGGLLPESVTLSADTEALVVVIDGAEQRVDLGQGSTTREAILSALHDGLEGCAVSLGEAVAGKAGLVFTLPGHGALSVYANPDLGFPIAARDENSRAGAPMGAALRSFFGSGGREAVIIRLGDPVPLMAEAAARAFALAQILGLDFIPADLGEIAALPGFPALPPSHPARAPWHGLAHLHALSEVTFVLLPDLPDLVATVPALLLEAEDLVRPPATFQACAPEPTPALFGAMRDGKPASVDEEGLELWSRIAAWAVGEIAAITPEPMLIAALPLIDPDADLLAADDILGLVDGGNAGRGLRHKQLQLVTPWLSSRAAQDMPGGALPADGMLAGRVAGSTLLRGAWRTVAGTRLGAGERPYGALPDITFETLLDVSLIGFGVGGPEILSDRTTEGESFTQANIRRLVALVLRAARHRGETAVFEPNGERFWRDVAMPLTTLLRQLHSAGALRGIKEEEAFQVLCGRETMSQADIDAGRAIAEITLAPAHSLEFIEVALTASASGVVAEGRARA